MNRKLLCVIWIASVVVVGGLLWFFTQGFRMRLLTEEVNNVLAKNGGGWVEPQRGFPGRPASVLAGTWFRFRGPAAGDADSGEAFVFSMIRNGISAACVALVDDGKVRTIIPLSENAHQLVEELPSPVHRFYVDRIEQYARNRSAKMGGSR